MKTLFVILLIPFIASSQPYDTLWTRHTINGVPNNSYVLKPLSKATQVALNLKAYSNNYTLHSPGEGATVNLVKNSFNIIDLSTIKTSLILNFPSNPSDKDFVEVKFTLAVTTVTYTGGVVHGGYVAPIAGTTVKFSYVQSNNTWY